MTSAKRYHFTERRIVRNPNCIGFYRKCHKWLFITQFHIPLTSDDTLFVRHKLSRSKRGCVEYTFRRENKYCPPRSFVGVATIIPIPIESGRNLGHSSQLPIAIGRRVYLTYARDGSLPSPYGRTTRHPLICTSIPHAIPMFCSSCLNPGRFPCLSRTAN